ncbi:MAG TPA: hypothetical protein VMV86_00680, partial [Methanosarcinales archaeon]|nr:hypothetical protein [Methanosarcinales archaeon]
MTSPRRNNGFKPVLKKNKPRHSEAYRKFCREEATREGFCAVREYLIDGMVKGRPIELEMCFANYRWGECYELCPQKFLCHNRTNTGMASKPDDFTSAY